MKIVYLDQNKWIDLARAYHGKSADPAMREALESVQQLVMNRTVAFPLSATHYMEIGRARDAERRERLGTVMWDISRGYTLAAHRNVLIHELEIALSRRFAGVIPRPFTLLGRGAAHAFGVAPRPYQIPEQFRSKFDPASVRAAEDVAQEVIEKATITGTGPAGITMPPFRVDSHKLSFKSHLEDLRPRLAELPQAKWDDALYAISLMDILEPVNEVLRRHGLRTETLFGGGAAGLKEFMNELPSRRADLHLHRQVLRNPQFKPKMNDLEDWAGLGPATAYCDIVVCEKHFASLLGRDNFQTRATVITDVRALPEVVKSLEAAAPET